MEVLGANTKVSTIVENNFKLLAVFSRLGMKGSFGEKTLAELCVSAGLDVDTVLLIAMVYSSSTHKPGTEELRNCHINDVLRYLRASHEYYVESAVKLIESTIEELIAPCKANQKQVIRNFFIDYKTELEKHFRFEEEQVIPYIKDLMIGRKDKNFSIESFEDNHSNIEETLSDFKNLVMTSLPHECDDDKRIFLLQFLHALQSDLVSHTYIEDNILVPKAKLMEDPSSYNQENNKEQGEPAATNDLSAREKEILVSVAKGLLNKEIADRHNISINTVITHRKNITRKTGIKTVPGLTVYAILNNLIDINTIE